MRLPSACTALCTLFVLQVACGNAPQEPTPPTAAPAPAATASPAPIPGLAGLAWLDGPWRSEDGARSEDWLAADGARVGVGFVAASGSTRAFEVMLLHEVDGHVVYSAMPGGTVPVDFAMERAGSNEAEFANPQHDHPQRIVYRREGETLRVELSGGGPAFGFGFVASPAAPSSELLAADTAFDADNDARGGAAWTDRFEADGMNAPYRGARTVGAAAIGEHIDRLRAGGVRLRWSPSEAGLSPTGDAGYTAGPYRVERDGAVVSRGVYVSIWRRQPDGSWKIRFDTGVEARPAARPGGPS